MKEITVTKDNAGGRLDKLLAKYIDKSPKSFIYKMLRKKNIVLNGKRAAGNEHKKGDRIRLFLRMRPLRFQTERIVNKSKPALPVIYEMLISL